MLKELEQRKDELQGAPLASVYFGGGTPSVLNPKELTSFFEHIHRFFNLVPNAEITLEANPEDMDAEQLALWRQLGINRLSIGLQSFNEAELNWMNRKHTAADSVNAVKRAQDAGFHNLSIDLIYGSKFLDLPAWQKSLETALSLNTPHISAYNLTIEPKTVLGLKNSRGQEPPVNDEHSAAQFLWMSEFLTANGFVHYEISNFGKVGYSAVHNSNYWQQVPYLGIGPSAHSYNGNTRRWNVSNNQIYLKALEDGLPYFETELLQTKDRYNEYIMTGLRTIWGCDTAFIEKEFGKPVLAHFLQTVLKINKHFLVEKGVYSLLKESRLLADGLAADLFMD